MHSSESAGEIKGSAQVSLSQFGSIGRVIIQGQHYIISQLLLATAGDAGETDSECGSDGLVI